MDRLKAKQQAVLNLWANSGATAPTSWEHTNLPACLALLSHCEASTLQICNMSKPVGLRPANSFRMMLRTL